jgi:hypothetical protein
LHDVENEIKWEFSLARSLSRAQAVPLLANYRVYVTPSVSLPGLKDIANMVRGARGTQLAAAPKQFVRTASNDRRQKKSSISPQYLFRAFIFQSILNIYIAIHSIRIQQTLFRH